MTFINLKNFFKKNDIFLDGEKFQLAGVWYYASKANPIRMPVSISFLNDGTFISNDPILGEIDTYFHFEGQDLNIYDPFGNVINLTVYTDTTEAAFYMKYHYVNAEGLLEKVIWKLKATAEWKLMDKEGGIEYDQETLETVTP